MGLNGMQKRIGENLLKINAFSYELFLFRNIYFIERKVYFWHFERFKEEPSTQTQTYCQMFMGIQKKKTVFKLYSYSHILYHLYTCKKL